VRITEGGIAFAEYAGPTVIWAAGSYRAAVDPAFASVRIERLPYSGESLLIEDKEFARSMAPGTSVNTALHHRTVLSLAALIAITALAMAAAWFSYPYLTDRVAAALPVSAEQSWGAV